MQIERVLGLEKPLKLLRKVLKPEEQQHRGFINLLPQFHISKSCANASKKYYSLFIVRNFKRMLSL